MQTISQNEIIALISDINSFADHAENLISSTKNTYQAQKKNIEQRHRAELQSLDSKYQANCAELKKKSQSTIEMAREILFGVQQLEAQLSRADKYYAKTRKKKEEPLADRISETYSDASDYFNALSNIQKSYKALSKKYSEDILPGLLNGLNYLFSSQRKKDYEELILLRNTVSSFVSEIEKELPSIIEENLASMKQSYLAGRNAALVRQKGESAAFENQYNATLERTAEQIYSDLDNALPDDYIADLSQLMQNYISLISKVNGGTGIPDNVLDMLFIDYPVDLFVESNIVSSIIKDKCASLMTKDGSIRLPVVFSAADAPAWMIVRMNSGENTTAVLEFTHALMFGMLSSVPVSRLVYSIVDPENRGTSVSPFFDAKKKLPDLFGEKIYMSKEDISLKITRTNEKIESILQERLGNQYDTVYDYAKDNPDYDWEVEILIIYDFPRGFDERTLAELRNVLRNGSRCGIYVIISYMKSGQEVRSDEFSKNVASIQKLSLQITQQENNFIFRGLPLIYSPMPDKVEFAKFFSKYMLIFEGIKNRGIAFSPLIKKLVEARDSVELEEHISCLCKMMKEYEGAYAQAPDLKIQFPSLVTLGSVLYPSDIFSDSAHYRKILDKFGTGAVREGAASFVELPLAFDLRGNFNLFLNCPEASSREMVSFTHHVIWSFLSFMPITKVNICIFDAEQRGNSVVPFLEFRKRLPDVFDQKIYTNSEMMLQRLNKMNEQIDEFIQEKLGFKYKNILEYNLNTPNRMEPVTLLLLYDFPSGMDNRSLDILANILRNGGKCGIFTVICYNPNVSYSRYESIDDRLEGLQKHCVMIEYKDRRYSLMPYNLQINIPENLSVENTDRFMHEYMEKSEAIKKQGLSFRDIISSNMFSMDSTKSMHIPVGVGDGDAIIDMVIGEGSSHHGLIAGATGSGKSTLLHTLIMSSMLHYTPDNLNLYLMDFKGGTEFKIYESERLPHIKLLALDAMQEFGESILENLVSEMGRRSDLFKESGQTSLKGYTQVTGASLPRILVIMDEFQILFNDSSNRKVAQNCAELTKRIVTEGRAFGIHLLMATQSTKVIGDLTLSRGTIEQMRIRVGLKCGEDDARYLFAENDMKALSMMKGPIGTAVMNLDYTEQSLIGFRAAYCDDDTQAEYLKLISSTFADYPHTLQTFEGNRTTRLLDYFAQNGIRSESENTVRIHLGTLIKVAPPLEISIDKKRRHNLLICGSNERMADIVSGDYMVSALLNRNASVYCIDGDCLVGDNVSQDFYEALSCAGERFKVAYGRGDIIRFIHEIYDKYQESKKGSSQQTVFVVIRNLQFLDIVKAMLKGEFVDESEYIEEEAPALEESEDTSGNPFAFINNMSVGRSKADSMTVGEQLTKMIEDGSGFGVHFIVTCLEYQTVKETMYYGGNILNKFSERVIFSLNNADADTLVENVSIAGMRDNTVYYTDGVRNTFQMKPYILPSSGELKEFMESVL